MHSRMNADLAKLLAALEGVLESADDAQRAELARALSVFRRPLTAAEDKILIANILQTLSEAVDETSAA